MNRFAILFLSCTLPLVAQQPAPLPEPVPSPSPVAERAADAQGISKLEFAGGTLGEFVDVLRRAPGRPNILVAPSALAVMLPEMSFHDVTVEQALEVACSVAEGDVQVKVRPFRGKAAPVFSVVVVPTGGRQGGPETHTQVISLTQLTEGAPRGLGVKVETVLSAIEAATEGRLAAMRFHVDSGLLIVRGNEALIDVVRNVLSEIGTDVERRRQEAAERAEREAAERAEREAAGKGSAQAK